MPYCALPDKTKLFFQIFGSELTLQDAQYQEKPTIVILHGGPGADHTFHLPCFETCSEFAQVIAYDHRGCGRSDASDSAHWNLRQWAEDLHDFCHTLGLDKPYILGNSFGGWVALQHSILYPNDAKGLILCDTEASFPLSSLLDAYEAIGGQALRDIVAKHFTEPSNENAEQFVEHAIPHFSKHPFPLEYFARCQVQPETAAYFNAHEQFHFNLLSELPKITAPVLYISGTESPMHRKADAQAAAAAMTNAKVQLELIEGYGYITTDQPEKVVSLVKGFVT